MTADEIRALVEKEMAAIEDLARRTALSAILVKPERHFRSWAYGPGSFECWTVARDDSRRVALVHKGEGAFAEPWGSLSSEDDDLGMDSEWFQSLDDAFIHVLWKGPLPPGYEVS